MLLLDFTASNFTFSISSLLSLIDVGAMVLLDIESPTFLLIMIWQEEKKSNVLDYK